MEAIERVKCSECKSVIFEPANLPENLRVPCLVCGSTKRDKEVVLHEGLQFKDVIHVRDELLWGEWRTGLLGIWMTVYITTYFTLLTQYQTENGFLKVALAVVSALFGFGILALFRSNTLRNSFFRYFDWVVRKRNFDLPSMIAPIVFALVAAIFLLLWLVFD